MKPFGQWFNDFGKVEEPAKEPEMLPENIWDEDGKYFATCVSCERDVEILCDIDDIPLFDYRHYCGGSPRCCP